MSLSPLRADVAGSELESSSSEDGDEDDDHQQRAQREAGIEGAEEGATVYINSTESEPEGGFDEDDSWLRRYRLSLRPTGNSLSSFHSNPSGSYSHAHMHTAPRQLGTAGAVDTTKLERREKKRRRIDSSSSLEDQPATSLCPPQEYSTSFRPGSYTSPTPMQPHSIPHPHSFTLSQFSPSSADTTLSPPYPASISASAYAPFVADTSTSVPGLYAHTPPPPPPPSQQQHYREQEKERETEWHPFQLPMSSLPTPAAASVSPQHHQQHRVAQNLNVYHHHHHHIHHPAHPHPHPRAYYHPRPQPHPTPTQPVGVQAPISPPPTPPGAQQGQTPQQSQGQRGQQMRAPSRLGDSANGNGPVAQAVDDGSMAYHALASVPAHADVHADVMAGGYRHQNVNVYRPPPPPMQHSWQQYGGGYEPPAHGPSSSSWPAHLNSHSPSHPHSPHAHPSGHNYSPYAFSGIGIGNTDDTGSTRAHVASALP
jgi:hypothetical protein